MRAVMCSPEDTLETLIDALISRNATKTSYLDPNTDLVRNKRDAGNFGRGRILNFGDQRKTEHYIMRVYGLYEYIDDNRTPLGKLRYVYECIKRNKKIIFTLEERDLKHAKLR